MKGGREAKTGNQMPIIRDRDVSKSQSMWLFALETALLKVWGKLANNV